MSVTHAVSHLLNLRDRFYCHYCFINEKTRHRGQYIVQGHTASQWQKPGLESTHSVFLAKTTENLYSESDIMLKHFFHIFFFKNS